MFCERKGVGVYEVLDDIISIDGLQNTSQRFGKHLAVSYGFYISAKEAGCHRARAGHLCCDRAEAARRSHLFIVRILFIIVL